jgi:hypothetical protein
MNTNNPGLMTVDSSLGPQSTNLATDLLCIDGKIAFISVMSGDLGREITVRMAACWNACAGLEPDHLARFGLGSATGSEVYRLREQNAELIDLLKESLSVCSSVSISKDRVVVADGRLNYWQTEEWCTWVDKEVQPKIRAAIAKATGEQQ